MSAIGCGVVAMPPKRAAAESIDGSERAMGTDIHLVTEKQVADGWLGVNSFPIVFMTDSSSARPIAIARNYPLFAALASVRGEGLPPRGIPHDASPLALLMLEHRADGHSHSWLGMEEAVPLFVKHACPMNAYPGLTHRDAVTDYVTSLFGAFGAEFSTLSRWRIVFWFDN